MKRDAILARIDQVIVDLNDTDDNLQGNLSDLKKGIRKLVNLSAELEDTSDEEENQDKGDSKEDEDDSSDR